MGWDRESIAAKRREKFSKIAEGLSREQLIDKIVELETALYPFAYTLGSLNDKAWKGTSITSKLFPDRTEDNKLRVYNHKTETSEEVTHIEEKDLHTTEFDESDSVWIMDGTLIDDELALFSVHQQSPGAYVGCGSVFMKDVRIARNLLFPDSRPLIQQDDL